MDPYAPCPCGSGKKVKFCCQAILPEMAKIERLQENNQPHMALQIIDKLLKENSDNGWLVTQRAMALFNDEAFEEARDGLVPFLRTNPEHPLANALLALAVSQTDTIEKTKKVIHRAFLKSMAAEPQLVAILAGKLVSEYLESGFDMAARQHMAMVLRLGSDQDRQRTLMAMLELDADASVPYPLRGGHPLPTYQPVEELQPQLKKAQRLYIHGCFSEAADILDKIAEQDPTSAALWHTIGLMRAWDADEVRAASALHKAAELDSHFDRAVDLETIAQILDSRQKENSVSARLRSYDVESLSKLLTRLDNNDRLSRVVSKDPATQVSASYEILDRNLPVGAELEHLTIENTPQTIGRLTLIDQTSADSKASAYLVALEGERLNQSVEVFEAAAGDLAMPSETLPDHVVEEDIVSWYPLDEIAITNFSFLPPQAPDRVRLALRRQFISEVILEKWKSAPQVALKGKSPLEAMSDDSLKVPLAAAIRVFDSFMDRRDLILDQNRLRDELGVPDPASILPSEDLDLNTLTVPQLQDLVFDGMSDKLFDLVMQRALVVKHCGLSYRVLTEFLNHRPALMEANEVETEQAFVTSASICMGAQRDEEALEWIQRGYSRTQSLNGSFESLLMWKMRELQFRSYNKEDPQLKPLLMELWNHYGAKLPAVRQRVQKLVEVIGIDPPWEHAIITPQSLIGEEGDWLAGSEATVSGAKKLWLPE